MVGGHLTRTLMLAAIVVVLAPAAACGTAPSCTVGLAGTDLTVTIEGWDSGKQCQAWIDQAGRSAYRRDVDPSSTLMCRITQGGDTYTVRDRGALKLNGTDVCARLQALTDTAAHG